MGYQYNLNTVASGGNFEPVTNKLTQIPRTTSSSMTSSALSHIAHLNSPTMGIWNLGFADGHVDASKSKMTTAWLLANPLGVTSSGQESAAMWAFVNPLLDDLRRQAGD